MTKQCKFRKKDGGRCRANAQSANGLCVFHDPARASDGHRARRAGGLTRTRSMAILPADTPDHPLTNPRQVSDLLAKSINQLRRGELDLRIANGIGYLAGVLLRALEQGPIEDRLANLEAALSMNSSGANMFDFRSAKETANDQSS